MKSSTLPHTLSLKQVRLALEAAEGETYVMAEVIYNTGIRCGELVAVRWEDIDLEERILRVEHGKGGKGRLTYFKPPCRDALLRYRSEGRKAPGREAKGLSSDVRPVSGFAPSGARRTRGEGPKSGTIPQDAHARPELGSRAKLVLAPTVYHRVFPISTQAVEQRFARLSERLPFKVWPHLLRHAFATGMAANGADIITIMTLLGHESVNTTMIYLHVDPNIEERGRVVADALAQARGQITKERLRRTITGLRWA